MIKIKVWTTVKAERLAMLEMRRCRHCTYADGRVGTYRVVCSLDGEVEHQDSICKFFNIEGAGMVEKFKQDKVDANGK